MDKPRVLLLGGCGFIGRNLLSYLISNNLAGTVRVVDKVPPQIAWLNKQCQEYFHNPIVEYKSANLINSESCKNAFGSEDLIWDYVINCAGETKPSQTDPVYEEGIFKLSQNCAKESLKHNVKHYVELSDGRMGSEKIGQNEDSPISSSSPWTMVAKWKYKVEQELKNQYPTLPYTILRLATVYGCGDRSGLTPRLMASGIYRYLKQTMKLLWDSEMKVNTVHVNDVCRAIWFVCTRNDTVGQIYNVVDEADSTQGSISDLLQQLFEIKIDYYGTTVSSLLDINAATEEANDKHSKPWAEACQIDHIENTPLSPHMSAEFLLHKHLCLNGDKLKHLGFQYETPTPTTGKLKEIIDDFVEMRVYPTSLAP